MDGDAINEKALPEGDDQASSPEESSKDPLIGTIIGGRFRIEELLGVGGMSVVYKARQLNVNRHVAIKTIRVHVDSKPVYRERFQREIDSLCTLAHPNIVTVYDCIIGPDAQPYVVMDYLRGSSLERLLANGPLTIERFARISIQICSALDHAHKKGVIHRDLKPGNILLMDDDMDFVKVVDFGLVKLREEETRKITQSGELWGSPPYMSPEQCVGESGDERSDIYSLGCVMYHMLTGRDPFWDAKSVFELIQRHVRVAPKAMSVANPDISIPKSLEVAVMTCLEKNPLLRFQTAHELQDAVVQAIAGQATTDLILHSPAVTNPRLPIIQVSPQPVTDRATSGSAPRPVSKWARPASGQQVVSKWARPLSGQHNLSKWAGIVSGRRLINELEAESATTHAFQAQQIMASEDLLPDPPAAPTLKTVEPTQSVEPSPQPRAAALDDTTDGGNQSSRNHTINAYSESFNYLLIALIVIGFGIAIYLHVDGAQSRRHYDPRTSDEPEPVSKEPATQPGESLYFTPDQVLGPPGTPSETVPK